MTVRVRRPTEHELKTWPRYFNAVLNESKTFELRKNDRDYRVGDTLMLREWDPASQGYTGRFVRRQVTYITRGSTFGLPDELCILAIKP